MGSNGFFGQIKGPFQDEHGQQLNVFNLIAQQCKSPIDYINKIGIHYPVNYDLNINHNVPENNAYGDHIPFVEIGDGNNPAKTFSLGKTGMLELEDVKIKYIKFISGNTINCYIDYQYIPNII